ncbi:unnamed protein product [Heligmosomoides polygyrus]|uniref:CHRD domain-containing protein n=1 Tax=Heligmosomoides polygyrus TaxID=6339 RepID=A0A183G3D4_HELPZ|nr:unnamed protein product [Heligmosomoides polygyrus]
MNLQNVNLGIGTPTLTPNYIPEGIHVHVQSKNGVIGVTVVNLLIFERPYSKKGTEDPDLINAGKERITLLKGTSIFGSDESFAMIRGSHMGITVLGALQVSQCLSQVRRLGDAEYETSCVVDWKQLRPIGVEVNSSSAKQNMTLEELRKYDGVQEDRTLLAPNGAIYDTSRGLNF